MQSDFLTKHRHDFYWLTGGLILSALPHVQRLPLWISVLFLLLCTTKVYCLKAAPIKKGSLLIIKVFLLLLMIAGVAGIHYHFGTIVGRNAGVTLLVLLSGFKIMEMANQRDFYVTCFLGYFMVVTNFLYTQSIITAVAMMVIVFIMTLSLVSLNNHQGSLSVKKLAAITLKMLGQSVPVMLILFILFPRVQGPLWGMPNDAYADLTGIDDVMSPGTVSQLLQSDKVAFRVDFKGVQLEQSQLYWRGPVLLYTDGIKWVRGKSRNRREQSLDPSQQSVAYTITLEPHNQQWVYGLDIPGQAIQKSTLTTDFQLLTQEPIRQRIRYNMVSYPDYVASSVLKRELQAALQLPKYKHQQTRALVQQWLDEGLSSEQIVERTLKLFSEDDFYYTLTPQVLAEDHIDEFLFQTKQGFCEHYTSAFVVMMRAAGIPARVVLGYQGGEYNPVGDYSVVYQRDAHAWAEIWRQNHGWVRIDPTAAVSPLRIIEGIESALPYSIITTSLVFSQNNLTRKLWQHMKYRLDAVNNQWNQWVISYGPNRQKQLLQQFGLRDVNGMNMTLLIIVAVIPIIAYLAFILLRLQPENRDAAKILYDQFCRKLARSGIRRTAYEGPTDFSQRACSARKDIARQIRNITDTYIAIRYASRPALLHILRKHVKAFRA